MQTSDLIILCVLLGCMFTYVPVFLCLFFTAAVGLFFFLDMPLGLLIPFSGAWIIFLWWWCCFLSFAAIS